MAATGVRLAVTSLQIRSWGCEVGIWIRGTVDCPPRFKKRDNQIRELGDAQSSHLFTPNEGGEALADDIGSLLEEQDVTDSDPGSHGGVLLL